MSHFIANIDKLLDIAIKAGDIIMGYYDQPVDIKYKEDNSPVTIADIAANDFIVSELRKIDSDLLVISEEDADYVNLTADKSEYFWLVDPLDGTKSFIQHADEFTVNIALIHKNQPIGGIIYIPTTQVIYYGYRETPFKQLAFKQERDGKKEKITSRVIQKESPIIVTSHSKRNGMVDEFLKTLPSRTMKLAASSMKFCMLAEGSADIYPRFGKTMEWDTAAGHAILNAAGGSVKNLDGSSLSYGKKNFENSNFIASGKDR
jgi:3'(2'), 5'-bisphosphate nucleotidase